MKLMKKYKPVLLIFMLFISACSKEKLNPVKSTSLSDAVVFTTADRIEGVALSLYAALKSGQMLGGRYLIYNDVRGRNFINEKNNSVTAYQIWNFTVTESDSYINNLWSAAYSAINKVNIFLDGMNTTGNAVVGDTLAKQYDGEAKFVRAVAYYTLLQLFCYPYGDDNGSKPGLPLRLTPVTGSGESDIARSTVGETYTQVLNDLNDAESELPESYGDNATNITRAQKNTVIAFKTRVYLSMGDYANVISEADKIVSSSAPFQASSGVKFALQSNIDNVFHSATTTENIFSLPFTGSNEAPGTQNQLGYYYMPNGGGYTGNGEYSLNASGIVADEAFSESDARRQYIDTFSNKYWLIKYVAPSPYIDWVPYMRYSEVLLSLAEAIVRNTNSVDSKAVSLLNAVHGRSDPSKTFKTSDFSSAGDLTNTILKEREIEFLGEGIYGTDISRLQATYPAKGPVSAVSINDLGYIFPAPTTETSYNSLWTN